MRQAFPDATGFSDTNVKYMKRWYLFYNERGAKSQRPVDQISQQVVDLLEDEKGQQLAGQIGKGKKGHQVGDLLEMPEIFGNVAWGHHVQIFSHYYPLNTVER